MSNVEARAHTYTHTFNGLFPGLPGSARTRKVKPEAPPGGKGGSFPSYGWTSKNYVICVYFHCHGTSSYHRTYTLQGRRTKSHVDTQTIQPGLGDFVLWTHYRPIPHSPPVTKSWRRHWVKPIWILLEQETVSGNGISWDICKSAPRSRQITTPAPHHSVSYRPDALPAAQPTASRH